MKDYAFCYDAHQLDNERLRFISIQRSGRATFSQRAVQEPGKAIPTELEELPPSIFAVNLHNHTHSTSVHTSDTATVSTICATGVMIGSSGEGQCRRKKWLKRCSWKMVVGETQNSSWISSGGASGGSILLKSDGTFKNRKDIVTQFLNIKRRLFRKSQTSPAGFNLRGPLQQPLPLVPVVQ